MGKDNKQAVDSPVQLLSFSKYRPINGKIRVLRNKIEQKRHQKIVTLQNDHVEHVGKNYGEEKHTNTVKYIIVVKEKSSPTASLVEVPQPFKIHVRQDPQSKPAFEIKKHQSGREYKRKLVQQFGTSKSKRKMNQMMNNTIE